MPRKKKNTVQRAETRAMTALRAFNSPANEGAVRKGERFETTPERAAYLSGSGYALPDSSADDPSALQPTQPE